MADIEIAEEVTPRRRISSEMVGDALGIAFRRPPPPEPDPEFEPEQYDRIAPGSVLAMIGQDTVRRQMLIQLKAAQRQNRSPGHMLLMGPMGLGKTTLARMVSTFMGVRLVETDSLALSKPNLLYKVLADLRPGDVLFIDEIHGLTKKVSEGLYKAMTEWKMNVTVGSGPGATLEEVKINKFVLVAASTQPGEMLAPLMQRFKYVGEMEYYSEDDLSAILMEAAVKYDEPIVLDEYAALSISMRSRGTPRVALKMLEQARDVAVAMLPEDEDTPIVDMDVVETAFELFDIDTEGLTLNDRAVLLDIMRRHNGGPVGIHNISATTGIDQPTIRNAIEPWLIRAGFMSRSQNGRVLTPKAYDHLRKSYSNIPNVPFHIKRGLW